MLATGMRTSALRPFHQCVWHVEADERVDAARYGSGKPLRYVALRYFNVADPTPRAHRAGDAGRDFVDQSGLRAMVGKRAHVSVFGSDYPTPDGTGVRDYLHVEDLASAHLCALGYLRGGRASVTLNVGYAMGTRFAKCCAWSNRLAASLGNKGRGAPPRGSATSWRGQAHSRRARFGSPNMTICRRSSGARWLGEKAIGRSPGARINLIHVLYLSL